MKTKTKNTKKCPIKTEIRNLIRTLKMEERACTRRVATMRKSCAKTQKQIESELKKCSLLEAKILRRIAILEGRNETPIATK